MAEHISKQFDLELETIRTRVLQMGGLVEAQIVGAIDGLMSSDIAKLDKVIAEDALVNAMEVSLDEECQHIIARRQPAASDLRMVITVIKTITDLERIGDEAQKVARMGKTILLADRVHMPRFREIQKMAEVALAMVPRARPMNELVATVTVGIPSCSTLDWSTTSHEVQEPQSHWAAMTRSAFMSLSALAMRLDSVALPEILFMEGSVSQALTILADGTFCAMSSVKRAR